jgi:predicted DNA-binding transcriptional regulator AlpA
MIDLLTVDDLVAELKLASAETVYTWRKRGYGPKGFPMGRSLRFRRADVDAWIAEQAADV